MPCRLITRVRVATSTVAATVALLEPTAADCQKQLTMESTTPVMATVDHEKIKQVVLNLIRNALDAARSQVAIWGLEQWPLMGWHQCAALGCEELIAHNQVGTVAVHRLNVPANVQPLVLGVPVDATIDQRAEYDAYSIDVQAGDEIFIRMVDHAGSGGMEPVLEL